MRLLSKISMVLLTGAAMAMTAGPASARRGADDPADHVRQCRGCDDPAPHAAQVRGADDATATTRRGVDNPPTDDRGRGRHGADDPPGDDRGSGGHGADDPA